MTKEQFLAMSLSYETVVCVKYTHVPDSSEYEYLTGIMDGRVITSATEEEDPLLPISDYSIILHPLTDLTKEIEYKGERLVPMIRLAELKVSKGLYVDIAPLVEFDCKIVNKPFGLLAKCTKLDEWVIMISLSEPERCDFWIIERLISWHFDICGLIEQGEAIDVNTLDTNPYA